MISLAIFSAIIIAILIGSLRWIKVYNHVVYFDNLPAHLEGFKILHISDLHSNSRYRMNLNIWRHIDNLDFDIAVITGDIILGHPLELESHREQLAALAARVPTFFVEGNHESQHFVQISRFMDDVGIVFLHNEIYRLNVEEGVLDIIGTADYSTLTRQNLFDNLDGLFAGEHYNFRLVLTHQPQLFNRLKDMGLDMMLAGHTHGGQLRMPFLPTIYAPGQGFWPEFGNGFYYHDDAVLYISRGLGTTYFPFRFWNRPEIAVLELSGNAP